MNSPLQLEQVRELSSQYQVIPIVESLFSGTETPVSIFAKLAEKKVGSFLLESAEQGVWSRYSFIGVNNIGFLTSAAGKLVWQSESNSELFLSFAESLEGIGSLEALEHIQKHITAAPISELPPLVSGMVGLIGWDIVGEIENIPGSPPKDFVVPDLAMAIFEDLVILDHLESTIKLVSNIFVSAGSDIDAEYSRAVSRIATMRNDLLEPAVSNLSTIDQNAPIQFEARTTKQDFITSIEVAKKHVTRGDVFQVVLSQRFDSSCHASPLEVYRMLRALNPSPYMYLLNFSDAQGRYAVVGSSPEALVRVQGGRAITHPIAGSRPRGSTTDLDAQLATDLLNDSKERAEHLMLVDLARNDLLKVCDPSSVSVTEFMQVERFSHIMHLVSTVEGKLRDQATAVDVLRATFPAGTLSGAPKPRALEIISELESSNRGLFGGVVGYFDFAGNADLAIAIRTAFIRDGMAYVQAGAGIVLDSDPESEFAETIAKASAPLRAIAVANSMRAVERT